jgi:hypothetical protein
MVIGGAKFKLGHCLANGATHKFKRNHWGLKGGQHLCKGKEARQVQRNADGEVSQKLFGEVISSMTGRIPTSGSPLIKNLLQRAVRHATALAVTSCLEIILRTSPAGLGLLKKYPWASVQPSRFKYSSSS